MEKEIRPNNICKVARQLMAVERAAWRNPRLRRILKAAPLVVLFLLLNSRPARAACSFNPTPDPTADGASNSLRQAIQAANASGQDCLIQLQAGTYTLTLKNTNSQENNAAEGDLDITDSGHTMTIQGQGAKVSIINGGGVNGINDRVFQVLGGANAIFEKLTIEGGVANDDGSASTLPGTTESDGGGVLVQDGGHVALSGVWIKGNQAIGSNGANTRLNEPGAPGEVAAGGGLFLSSGMVKLNDSKLLNNAATGGNGGQVEGSGCVGAHGGAGGHGAGGGLYVFAGSATVLTSMVSGNSAGGGDGGKGGNGTDTEGCYGGSGGPGGYGAGGGAYIASGSVRLSRSTISHNYATGASGGHIGIGDPTFGTANGLAVGGAAQGAGLFIKAGALHLSQTTVAANLAMGGTGGTGSQKLITVSATGGSALGAGLFAVSGHINLSNSTFFGNQSMGGSGGPCVAGLCYNLPQGGSAAGGGLYVEGGSVSLTGDTVASNQALTGFELTPGPSFGGGIANVGAASLVSRTTLIGDNEQDSGSTSNGDDISGAIIASFSLIGQTRGAVITNKAGNIFNVDPGLDPDGLQSNGGPNQTVALEISSPAIDKGFNAVCTASAPMGLAGVDQRSYNRFLNGDNLCDIGAFEFINLLVQPQVLRFGSVPVGRASIMHVSLTNNQLTSVTPTLTFSGADLADFYTYTYNGCITLAPRATCTISIFFEPVATGTRTAVLTVSDSPDRTSPYTVKLTGEGG